MSGDLPIRKPTGSVGEVRYGNGSENEEHSNLFVEFQKAVERRNVSAYGEIAMSESQSRAAAAAKGAATKAAKAEAKAEATAPFAAAAAAPFVSKFGGGAAGGAGKNVSRNNKRNVSRNNKNKNSSEEAELKRLAFLMFEWARASENPHFFVVRFNKILSNPDVYKTRFTSKQLTLLKNPFFVKKFRAMFCPPDE